MKLHTSLCYLALFTVQLQMQATVGQQSSDGLRPALETCHVDIIPVSGLRPDSASGNCRKFWLCRGRELESGKSEVQPWQFSCPDVSKPFFNHFTCQCEANKDHCGKDLLSDNCIRRYNDSDPPESCSSWGINVDYYTEIFPHMDNSSLFWICTPTGDPVVKSTAVLMTCPHPAKFDMRTCRCEDDVHNVSHEHNTHPMNRFNCAKLLM